MVRLRLMALTLYMGKTPDLVTIIISVSNKKINNFAIHCNDCGYSTVWKFSNFPVTATLILREINFG